MASCAVVGEGSGRTWYRPKGDRIKQQAGDLRDNCATLARFEGADVPENRKLAAILAADVAGYSKLAAAD